MTNKAIALAATLSLVALAAKGLDYPYVTSESQKTGWPLTDDERAYVLKPEHERRPGSEAHKHLPQMWPAVPSAGNFGGTSWLDIHTKLVANVEENKGTIGILLIGNNNMFFAPETGVKAAARGIQMCVANVREKFPNAGVIAVKIFPAHATGNAFYENINKTNAALDALKLDSDPKVQALALTNDFLNADGTLKPGLFTPDNIHLTQDGGYAFYALYASKLKPAVQGLLAKP